VSCANNCRKKGGSRDGRETQKKSLLHRSGRKGGRKKGRTDSCFEKRRTLPHKKKYHAVRYLPLEGKEGKKEKELSLFQGLKKKKKRIKLRNGRCAQIRPHRRQVEKRGERGGKTLTVRPPSPYEKERKRSKGESQPN